MIPARKKIAKDKGAEPDDFEQTVAQVIATADLCTLYRRLAGVDI